MSEKSVVEKDACAVKDTVAREIACLKKLEDLLATAPLSRVLDLMQQTQGRIIFTGMGKSGIVAKKIVASLASTGTPAFFVHPAEASHGDLGMISSQDMVVAISNSGESKELADILNYCKRFGITLVGITKNADSTLAKYADCVLPLPNMPEADPLGLAPTSSTTATLVLGDVLTVALMNRKQFTKQDFQVRHPGGKLGAVLQRVKDIMHTGDEIPLLNENTPIPTVLVEMSNKRLGCVGFTNEKGDLTGIFTDGDLRRKMSPALFNQTGADVMTKNPKNVSGEMMAAEALHFMNEKKITTLFVTVDRKPVGIVHIHDLLKLGL